MQTVKDSKQDVISEARQEEVAHQLSLARKRLEDEQRRQVVEAHRAMDSMGVSQSVYQAARVGHIREQLGSGWAGNPADLHEQDRVIAAQSIARAPLVSGGERRFTRAEVLAVLKSRKAILVDRPHFTEAARELDTLVDVFTRME